jgi:uncharacterized membrane protein
VSELIVLSFPTEADAASALSELRGLEKDGQVHFNDTAVVTRDPDGRRGGGPGGQPLPVCGL